MKRKRNNVDKLSIDEEFHMCAAYRYCIGRKTGASQDQAGFIAQRYYDKLSDDRLIFTAQDIRSEIERSLNFGPYGFRYDGSVSYEKRLPLEDFMTFIEGLDNIEEELLSISSIEVYCESYKEDAPKKFDVSRHERNVFKSLCQYDIDCLLPWQRLAALFDKKHYKKLKVTFNGEEKEAVCIETYVEDCAEIPEQPGYCRRIPWKYKKVYMDVDKIKSGNMHYCSYYVDEYIVSVEDYDATQD